jgi:hypothetical protein
VSDEEPVVGQPLHGDGTGAGTDAGRVAKSVMAVSLLNQAIFFVGQLPLL